ncbi:hypothetical protein WICPIJ_006173 [Wickerhamomyces pijperi]|uniref:Zn(2)-C6 fungal-type domain-containing protein n=1 Tax=Wickerhamomyces pijperi TaxID=599730 RepID=A0A9P8TL74_WICPI|nr:hypothetical protein WICPIJ_006173 [Wickerhamomyces pijperi]
MSDPKKSPATEPISTTATTAATTAPTSSTVPVLIESKITKTQPPLNTNKSTDSLNIISHTPPTTETGLNVNQVPLLPINISGSSQANNKAPVTKVPISKPNIGAPSHKYSAEDDEATKLKSSSKKMACVECRQQKSKCDAQDRYPDPCSRCMKKKVSCSLQSDYKRTYKRAKFQRIEEELQQLKKNLGETGVDLLQQLKDGKLSETGTPIPATPGQLLQQNLQNLNDTHPQRIQIPLIRDSSNSTTAGGTPLHPTIPYFNNPVVVGDNLQQDFKNQPSIIRDNSGRVVIPDIVKEKQPEVYKVSPEAMICQPKQFGGVELSSEQIQELFMEFVNRYHRFLPIIDVKKGPERIYRYSPILFWTIISIALRQISSTTLMQLAPLLKTAFAEISISPITRYLPDESDEPILNVSSVFSVQAFLLYTFWPPLTSSLSADSSWNTVGIAIFQAIRLGLNGPGMNNYNHHESSKILSEHVRTWISCNIVSQTIATAFGFPAFNSFDSAVIGSTRTNNDIPLSLKHMVQISHFEDQIAKVLNSNTSDPNGLVDPAERLPLLKVLYKQFVELEIKLESEGMDDVRKFQLLSTKVHLLTYYFLDNSRIANFELRYGLVSLYNAALNFLTHLGTLTENDPHFLKHCPVVFIVKIWQAACIVAKLVHSAISDVIDVGTGRQVYTVAIQSAMKASILKHDIAYRSSGLMRNMWQLFKALREQSNISNLTVTVKTRMSASLFFDCLWVLREQVGMIKLGMNDKNKEDLKEATGGNSASDEEEDEEAFLDEGAAPASASTAETNVGSAVQDHNRDSEEALDEEAGGSAKDPGTNNSENSTQSASIRRRPRSLSNNHNAEHAARKIIKTIPLDPSPITIKADQRLSSTSPLSNSSTPGGSGTAMGMVKPLQSSLRDVIQRQNTPDIVVPVISHERGPIVASNSSSSKPSVTPQANYSNEYQIPPSQQRSLFSHHHQHLPKTVTEPQPRQQSLPPALSYPQSQQTLHNLRHNTFSQQEQTQSQFGTGGASYSSNKHPDLNTGNSYLSPSNIPLSLDFHNDPSTGQTPGPSSTLMNESNNNSSVNILGSTMLNAGNGLTLGIGLDDWDTDIWKEVGSVMNDFGFNADS